MAHKSSSLNKRYAVFLIPGIFMFLLFVVFPLLANIGISFTRWTGIGTPTWIGLANYTKAFNDPTFWDSFSHNLYLIFAMTVIPTIIGVFLATVLFDYIADKFGKGVSSFFRAGFYLPQIIPVAVMGVIWRWVLQPNWGPLNWLLNFIGLNSLTHNWLGDTSTTMYSIMGMMVWFQIGYPLVIFMAALQRLDPQLYEAATLDGASWLQRFFYITIRLIQPEIYVVVLTTMIHALKIFGPIWVMTKGGPGTASMVASYFSFQNFFEHSAVGYGATISTILTIIIILITIGYLRIQARQEQRWV